MLDVVAHVVLGEPIGTAEILPPATDTDFVVELVGAASANVRRLAVASRLWHDADDRAANLSRVMADAVTRGIASSAAVNVAGAMVGAAAAASEEELVRIVTRARTVLADADLIAGAAALMLALTAKIAGALALDPVTVEFELRRA